MVTDTLILDALADLAARQPHYQLYRNYYEGRHRLAFAKVKMTTAFADAFKAFADNLCAPIVDAGIDRLHIKGWNDDAATDAIAQIVRQSQFGRVQDAVHLDAEATGDGYLIVWPSRRDGQPRIVAQRGDQVHVIYDDEDPTVTVLAVRAWRAGPRIRVNAYWPDRIERYQTVQDAKTPRFPRKPEDLEFVADDPIVANPYGEVPVYHLARNSDVGETGRSVLADVIPMQDALNKTIADALVAGEFWALPIRARIGVDEVVNPFTGQPEAPKVSPGSVWNLPEGASVQQLPGGDLSGFLASTADIRREISTLGKTPLHILGLNGDDFPSGESLKTAERPLTGRVTSSQQSYTQPHAGAMRMALLQRGITVGDDFAPIWVPAEITTEAERLAAAEAKLRIGYSRRQVLLDLGVSSDDVDVMLADADDDRAAASAAALSAFDAGLAA